MDDRLKKAVDTVLSGPEKTSQEKQTQKPKGLIDRKKTFLETIYGMLFAENPIEAIWSLTKEQVSDFVKDFFAATVLGGLEESIYKDRRSPRRTVYGRPTRSLDNPSWSDGSQEPKRKGSRYDNPGDMVDEILFETKMQAEDFIMTLENKYLATYHKVTVSNVNDELGRTGKSFNGSYFGWTTLDGVRIKYEPSVPGWSVEFPIAKDIR